MALKIDFNAGMLLDGVSMGGCAEQFFTKPLSFASG
jgi:altronate dehydratase